MKKLILFLIMFSSFTINAQEKFEWVKTFGSKGKEEGHKCTIDSNGDFLFTGSFSDTLSIADTTLYTGGGRDMFILKTDENGNFIWMKHAGEDTAYSTIGKGITADEENNVYVGGTFRDSIKIGGETLYGEDTEYSDIILMKFDSNGEFQWAKIMDGPGGDVIEDIVTYGDYLLVTGSYKQTMQIEDYTLESDDPEVSGNYNPFVAAFDLNGDIQWVNKIDCRAGTCRDIDVDPEGRINMIVEGKGSPVLTSVTSDYQKPMKQSSSGSTDNYLLQLAPETGEMNWNNRLGSDGFEMGYAITNDNNGDVYGGGLFQGEFTMDSQDGNFKKLNGAGSFDAFVCKYDKDGNLVWGDNQGGANIEGVLALSVNGKGNVYAAAYFLDPETTIGDTTYAIPDGNEALLIKYDNDGNLIWSKATHTSNTSGYIYSLASTHQDSILMLGHFQGEGTFFNEENYANHNEREDIWYSLMKDVKEETEDGEGNDDEEEEEPSAIYDETELSVKIYPNPASGRLFVETKEKNNEVDVKLYDTRGTLVKSCRNVIHSINVNDLLPGTYLMELIVNNENFITRIIITN